MSFYLGRAFLLFPCPAVTCSMQLVQVLRNAAMPGIFINYRRDDAPGVAGRLYDYLAKSFSRRDLFIDVDYIKPGLDFVKQLDTQVSQCDVMLALIGPHWLVAEDEQGRRRLHGDKDYVRIEIASALKRDIPVIPVLIHGAELPAADELPEDLKSLARRQALELRHTRFAADVDAIVSALKACLPKRKRWVWSLAVAACLVGALAGWFLFVWPGPTPPEVSSPASSTALPQLPDDGAFPVEHDTDRPGGDFHNFDLPQPRHELCRDACAAAPNCRAYTYVKPGVQRPNARCWLKSIVPPAMTSQCCISGARR